MRSTQDPLLSPLGSRAHGIHLHARSRGKARLSCCRTPGQVPGATPIHLNAVCPWLPAGCACKLIRTLHTELRETQTVTRGPNWGRSLSLARFIPGILSHCSPGKLKFTSTEWGFNYLKARDSEPCAQETQASPPQKKKKPWKRWAREGRCTGLAPA